MESLLIIGHWFRVSIATKRIIKFNIDRIEYSETIIIKTDKIIYALSF